jgi:hypothetical protein
MASAQKEELRILDEFVCEAIRSPNLPAACGHGENDGINVIQELIFQPLPVEKRELEKKSSPELLDLIQKDDSKLTVEEVKTIIQIALERIGRNGDPSFAGSKQLLTAAAEAACRMT